MYFVRPGENIVVKAKLDRVVLETDSVTSTPDPLFGIIIVFVIIIIVIIIIFIIIIVIIIMLLSSLLLYHICSVP